MRPIRSLAPIFVVLSIVSLAGRVHANEDTIELPLQRAKCLCGIVTYENGDPARGAKVEELGQDFKGATYRSTESDSEGRFALTPVKDRKIYYLEISTREPGIHMLHVTVKLSQFRGTKLLRLQLHPA